MANGGNVAQLGRHGMVAAVAFIPCADKLAEFIKSAKDPTGVAVTVVCRPEKQD